jgi:hypothetical protein
VIGQRWTSITRLHGEIIAVYDGGSSGVLAILDQYGIQIDTYAGSVAGLLGSGHWQQD